MCVNREADADEGAGQSHQKTCHFDRSAGGKTGGAEWRAESARQPSGDMGANLKLFFGQGGAEHSPLTGLTAFGRAMELRGREFLHRPCWGGLVFF